MKFIVTVRFQKNEMIVILDSSDKILELDI